MKKNSIFLLFVSLLFALFTIACNQKNKKSQKESDSLSITNPDTRRSQIAEELFERLMVSFGSDWMERESDPDLYPDYYGGSFINNNGIFVVAITGNRDENKKRLTEILGTDNFDLETVQYSYRQMMRVMDKIDAFLEKSDIPDDHPVMARFAGAYPDVTVNRVKVILTKVDDAAIKAFQSDISNSPLVVFEQGDLPAF